jgi:GH43 family beta-xylosidase
MSLAYTNPVWPGYFADPFVLRVGDTYYAYGTGTELDRDRRDRAAAFSVLRSTTLTHWEHIGGVLPTRPGEEARAYWAPEVALRDGRFYLYYSSAPPGRDELHRLHVAVADRPEGPFEDKGVVLRDHDEFTIDADPFCDPRTGRWYLFFARDFFEERTGTGLAVAPLSDDMMTVAAPPRSMLRANADWQIYERDRPLYGRRWAAWHTVEGPCVVYREGRYYCFYSGGNWQTRDYGVSYAVADNPLGPWQHAPEAGPVVLRERPPHALGPGHNSYCVAPDGTELLVYHAWDAERRARRMCIDPLVWTPEGPRCLGPTLGSR